MNYCSEAEAYLNEKFPSQNNAYGYCMCAKDGTTFTYCSEGEIFDITSRECAPSTESQCDISLCANATVDNTYTTPAKSNNSYFCFCSGPNNVMLLSCPNGKYYSDTQQKCVSSVEEGCSCPNGLQNGDRTADSNDCTKYYECNGGTMHHTACPSGKYFSTSVMCCIEDDGTCCNKNMARTCIGAYSEGERISHPYNEQMYYVCENNMLHERDCGLGRIFDQLNNQCQKASRVSSYHHHHNHNFQHSVHKRSAEVDEVRTFKKFTDFFTKYLW
ncbi:uncharacterized protein LOC142232952 [Haematobia irritans]|uniref:uncharacterized protein LOC142232952 n=1 Tax=Haematobia irritans TaxID=7368 RepID=UPI003F4FBA41